MGRMLGRAGHGRGIGLALVLALGLVVALAGLVVGLGQPGTALAQPAGTAVTCTNDSTADQSSLQSALNAAPTDGTLYTVTLSPNCTIDLTSSLTVGAGVNITLDGNGLTLNGSTTSTPASFAIIAIDDTQGNPSTLTVNQVTVENGAQGIYDNGGATVTVNGGTVRGNAGPGIVAYNSATVTDSTISDNDNGVQASSATVIDSTISGNRGAGIAAFNSMTLTATILAGNRVGNCFLTEYPSGTITDGGYNLSTDSSCNFSTANHSQNNASATAINLQSLADNGGPSETQALGTSPTSIAIDAIPVNGQGQCLNAAGTAISYPGTTTPITSDQRGVTRPQGAKCDIGAYELIQGSYTQTETTCPTQAQLQDDLNLGTPGTKLTIALPPNCTIDLASSLEVGANVNVAIDGNGLTLVGNGTSTAGGTFDDIDVANASSTLTLIQVTVERGAVGIGTHGGVVDSVVLVDSAVSDNASNGIVADTATLTNSTISDNADDGINALTITLTNSTVSGNRGYGVWAAFTATVSFSTISGNGGVGIGSFINGATLTASLLAGNGQNCSPGFMSPNDGGYNLSTDTSCGFSATGSQQGTAVANGLNVLALGNYGGPTQTVALGPGSIAIDAIPTGTANGQIVCLNAAGTAISYPGTTTPITTDQRGIDRSQGNGCDIGAYEAPALSLTVNPAQANGNNGWYTTDPSVTLGYSGLAIGQDSTGTSQAQVASCSGLSGLSHTATGLNDSGSVRSTVTVDGTYALSCGVEQGTTTLGYSSSGPQLPLTLKVDTTPPVITVTTPTATSYTLHQTVDASYGCDDATSGTASCAGTVPNGQPIDTNTLGSHTVTVTATDNAGNTATEQVTYMVGYAMTSLPGNTTTVNQGYYALLRFYPMDANGRDEASRTLPVTSVELVGDGQTIPFVHQFQFGTFTGEAGYQLAINTRNLSAGSWKLEVQIGSGANAVDGWLTFTVVG